MKLSRRSVLASPVVLPALLAASTGARLGIGISSYGVRSRLEPEFRDPVGFVSHCEALGVAGVQLPIGIRDEEYAGRLRRRVEGAGMVLEGSARPPDPDDPKDLERFEAELRTASLAGASVVRTVLLASRRYETFRSAGEFGRFRDRSLRSLRQAEPLLGRLGIDLAVENHKDFRTDEQLGVLGAIGSERIGVCVDFGNNLALLQDPGEAVRALAPLAITSHVKDMGVAEMPEGFLLAEVPLGRGMLDLPTLVGILRASRPGCRFMLEMITRDPLRIPCLEDGYWETMADVPGRDLARTLATVRSRASADPLPRVEGLAPGRQVDAEEANVRECLAHARQVLGL